MMKARLRTQVMILGISAIGILASCAAPPQDGILADYRELPAFDWPPEKSSDVVDLKHYFPRIAYPDYSSIADLIQATASDAGYSNIRYYGLQDRDTEEPIRGFVMVSRIEEINSQGASFSPRRFIDREIRPSKLGFWNILSALFYAPQGHYRVILFAVTADFGASGQPPAPTRQTVDQWVNGGALHLGQYGRTRFEQGERVYAYVYQFQKTTAQASPSLANAPVAGRTHLERAGFNFSRTNQ